MRKILIVDPIPEGAWSIESTADNKAILRGIHATSLHIQEVDD